MISLSPPTICKKRQCCFLPSTHEAKRDCTVEEAMNNAVFTGCGSCIAVYGSMTHLSIIKEKA
uniref:hypothetical protein n=1 Tax=Escherichia coli TaxID=562 RepID=UPI003D81499E